MTRPGLAAGIDLGSTGMKVLIVDRAGREIVTEQVRTPWRQGARGTSEIEASALLAAVRRLLDAAAARLSELDPGADSLRVEAIAVSGMGETGMLIDDHDEAVAPGFAWFDPRGVAQVAAFPDLVRAEFAGRTGLPLGAQVSVAKLAYLRDHGVELRGLRWLNLPEFVAMALGGRVLAERSLMSRTGLVDQDTGQAWPAMLDALGVDSSFLPPLVDAGASFGRAAPTLPAVFAGAALTVAGHDHLVAAEADGGLPADHYHVSLGTAEVLLRVIDRPLGFAARARLADHLINEVQHVVPGKRVLVAGVKTGLLLRRALQAAGVSDRAGRDRLDAAAGALPYEGRLAEGAIEVSGARNDDGVLRLTVRADDVSPAEIFDAVLRHSNDEIELLVAAMDAELPPARTSTLTGGWAGMASVQRARARVLPQLRVSLREQETALGAARVALRLMEPTSPTTPPRTSVVSPTGTTPDRNHVMNDLTTLERRGMTAISTDGGSMLIVAADQRNGMKAVMDGADAKTISTTELAAAKADLVTFLANHAPAILLDPEVALPAIVDDAVLARGTGLVVGMDASGFETVDGLRYARFVDGVTPRTVRDLGGDVAKMLWYARPDRQGADSQVAEEIRDLVKACEAEGLLLIVELLTYQLDGETDEEYAAAFPGLVAEGARLAVGCGAKVLKLQYPGSARACAAVTAAVQGVPWAVLSAGVDHETFLAQVTLAMANGASGAMAGRSLWKDSLSIFHDVREQRLTERALPRLRELAAVVDRRP